MANITIYTSPNCAYCMRAKQLLKHKGADFDEINLAFEPTQTRLDLVAKTKHHTVPQIFINHEFIGGFDELYALERQGILDEKLSSNHS